MLDSLRLQGLLSEMPSLCNTYTNIVPTQLLIVRAYYTFAHLCNYVRAVYAGTIDFLLGLLVLVN